MFGSSLPPVVCTSAHVLFTLFVCFFFRIVVSNRYCVVWFFFVLALCIQCSQFFSYTCENKNMHVFLIHSNEVFAKKLHRNNHAKNAYITSTKQENVKIEYKNIQCNKRHRT
jgi:predicted membrane protein